MSEEDDSVRVLIEKSNRGGPVGRWVRHWYGRLRWPMIRLRYRWRRSSDKVRLAWNLGLTVYLGQWFAFRRQYRELLLEFGDRVKKGRLEAFAETGTEGFCWELNEDGQTGYAGLVGISSGDRLIILLHDGAVAFDGKIDEDFEAGYMTSPWNPEYGQPAAFGCWIHWTQRGWSADDWAALFMHGMLVTEEHPLLSANLDVVPLRAIIVKKEETDESDED